MATPSDGSILIASFGAPHGVRGDIRVNAFTDNPEALVGYGPLTARDGRTFEIATLFTSGRHLVARVEGVTDRDQAAALTGTELYVPRTALPAPDDPDEFYQADLIGLAAETVTGEAVGMVVAVQNYGAGDLIEIAPPSGAPILVPFTHAAVPEIDLAGRRLIVDPPPGLLEDDTADAADSD